MYAGTARFRRVVFAGLSLRLMLAIVAICAITLGTGAVAGAAESLYAQATSSHGHHGKGKDNGSRAKTPAIVTQSGPLKGIIVGNTSEFLGIPYAAPPVGNLRWTPPQPFGRWNGLLNASSFGNVCTQSGRGSEDCLFLNIYVPNFKKNGNKHGGAMPVMFWIHGG